MNWSLVSAKVRRYPIYGGPTPVVTLPPLDDLAQIVALPVIAVKLVV